MGDSLFFLRRPDCSLGHITLAGLCEIYIYISYRRYRSRPLENDGFPDYVRIGRPDVLHIKGSGRPSYQSAM